MATQNPISTFTKLMGWVLQVLEPLLVLAVGPVVVLAERLPQAVVIAALLLLVLPFGLRFLAAGRTSAPTLANWPLLCLLLLALSTIWVTPAWAQSWPELARLLWGLALLLAVVNWALPLHIQTQPRWIQLDATHAARPTVPAPRLVWLTLAFVGMGLLLVVVGMLDLQQANKLPALNRVLAWLPSMAVGPALGFNPNRVAGAALPFAPLVLLLLVGPLLPERRTLGVWLAWLSVKGAALLGALGFGGVLLLTQSRSAWLGLGVALCCCLTLLGRRGWLLLALLLALAGGGLLAVGPDRVLNALTVRTEGEVAATAWIQDRNLAGRFILWERALNGIADAPLTGMGLAAFTVLSQQPYAPMPNFHPDPDMSHVHNLLLQVGLDLGVPGLLAFGAFLLMVGLPLLRLVRQSRGPLRTWSVALLGAFLAYFVYNLLDAMTLGARPAMVGWFLWGLCLAASEVYPASVAVAAPRRKRKRRSTHSGTAPPPAPSPAARPQPTPVAAAVEPTPPAAPNRQAPAGQSEWERRAWEATSGRG
ncbi:MAG: O-antigen ligase family protein [Caldilineaceae bacterium]